MGALLVGFVLVLVRVWWFDCCVGFCGFRVYCVSFSDLDGGWCGSSGFECAAARGVWLVLIWL